MEALARTRREERKEKTKETRPSGFDAMPINFYSFIEHSGIMKASTAVNNMLGPGEERLIAITT